MTKQELAEYVIGLKLSPQQKAFAEAYVLAPDNAASAAAQVSPKILRASAARLASRWLKLPRVRAYIEVLRNAPGIQAERDALAVAPVISTATALARGLEILVEQAEGRLPTEERQGESVGPTGGVTATKQRVFGRFIAASKIVDHYAPREEASGGNRTMIFNLLGKVPPEVLLPQVYSMISGGRTRPPRDDD